jgi:DNA mismatch endonuclease (patch repair protein)
VGAALRDLGLRFVKHDRALPGRPDIVFSQHRVAVFIDGDFWHGFRYPLWTFHLSPFWRRKIEGNRARDRANFARLRRRGWRVVRIWQHQVKRDLGACVARIVAAL